MNKIQGALKSKTMLFSLLLVVFGVVEQNVSALQTLIPPQYYGLVVMVIGMICAALRWVTSQPLEEK